MISGDVNDNMNFEFGDGAVAHNGCGATLFGDFWYFGGGTGSTSANSQKRKVKNSFWSLIGALWLTVFLKCIQDEQSCRM